MPRIVLDGLPLFVRSAGIGRYTESLARSLAAVAPSTDFALLGPRYPPLREPLEDLPDNLKLTRSWRYPFTMDQPFPTWPKPFGAEALAGRHDLFHGTTFVAPASWSTPLVLTVHDLALIRCPEWGTRALRTMVRQGLDKLGSADRIIANSESTRRDIVEICGIPPEKIAVTYLGVEARYRPLDRLESRALVESWLGTSGPFVLHVGTLEPRKNLETLVAAFKRARLRAGTDHKLLLAGDEGWGAEPLLSLANSPEHRSHVRVLGRVPEHRLPTFYCAADVFAYPSLHEGFGLPVAEALASGTPVLTSDVAALPEVVGESAVLIDPRSEAEIAGALGDLLTNDAKRLSLSAAGIERARRFNWRATAEATVSVYSELLGEQLH